MDCMTVDGWTWKNVRAERKANNNRGRKTERQSLKIYLSLCFVQFLQGKKRHLNCGSINGCMSVIGEARFLDTGQWPSIVYILPVRPFHIIKDHTHFSLWYTLTFVAKTCHHDSTEYQLLPVHYLIHGHIGCATLKGLDCKYCCSLCW